MSRRLLFALVVACGCGGAERVRPVGRDYLEALRVEGNRAIADDALAPALALHETLRDGAAVDPYLLASDTERIRIAYWKRGFFAARVAARVERTDHAQTAVFTVVEGRRAATRVEITGLPPELPLARARALVGISDGAPFDYATYDAAKLALKTALENAGYARAEVPGTVDADPEAATATVRLSVAAGEPARFGEVRIAGTVRPQLVDAVRGRLAFAPGDRYSLSALEQSQLSITELGRFSTVQLEPDRNPTGPVGISAQLAEASRHEVHGGGGLGYDQATAEVRVRGGFSFVPPSQPLLNVSTDLRAAETYDFTNKAFEPKVRLLATLQRLDLLRPHVRGELEAGVDYQTVESYRWTGEHARVGVGMPLGRRWLQLHLGWQLAHYLIDHQSEGLLLPTNPEMPDEKRSCTPQAESLGFCGDQTVGTYQASIIADLRDNPIEPHRGAYVDLRVAAGTPFAGSELSYLQLVPELRGYFSVGGLVIAGRARVGAFFGDVPVTERFYAGGTAGQRGFANRQLSPKLCSPRVDMNGETDTQCAIDGGAAVIETGVELRHRLGTLADFPIGASVFLDGADVTPTPAELDPSKLYWAVGAGVWSKVVGDLKVRVDLGFRINRLEASDPLAPSSWRDYFNVNLGVGESY